MTNWTTENTNNTSWTNESETTMTDTWENLEKSGTIDNGGYDYDEEDMEYDQDIDEDTGNQVFYDGLGQTTTWNNINKTI